jgi:single-strand DNA-binding protein
MQNNTFIGRIAAKPETNGSTDNLVTKFTLMAAEYAGKNKEERTIALPFTAFSNLAKIINDNVDKGDQLIVSYRVENNNYEKDGNKVYSYNFIVNDFEFGQAGSETRKRLDS